MIRILIIAAATALLGCAPREAPPTLTAGPPPVIETQEPCVIPPKGEPRMCTQQYEPVCGCDGQTYGNACVATTQGVQRFTSGRCDDPPKAKLE